MRYGKRFRLTPPWPPGLESIKKALLGPARYRRSFEPAAPLTGPYDDTLLIALAVQAHVNGNDNGFNLDAPGLKLLCRLETELAASDLDALLMNGVATAPALDENTFMRLASSAIIIDAHLDSGIIRHRSWICRKTKTGEGIRWNTAFNKALQLIRGRPSSD